MNSQGWEHVVFVVVVLELFRMTICWICIGQTSGHFFPCFPSSFLKQGHQSFSGACFDVATGRS